MSVSDTAVSYQEAEGEQTIQKQDVRSLKLMENKYRFEGPSQTSTMTDNLTSNHQQAKARA